METDETPAENTMVIAGLAIKLAGLLADPQPGLSTWVMMRDRVARDLFIRLGAAMGVEYEQEAVLKTLLWRMGIEEEVDLSPDAFPTAKVKAVIEKHYQRRV